MTLMAIHSMVIRPLLSPLAMVLPEMILSSTSALIRMNSPFLH
ncbi:MAG: hypothetical protein ABW168_11215 [Sedimenticola sp.]